MTFLVPRIKTADWFRKQYHARLPVDAVTKEYYDWDYRPPYAEDWPPSNTEQPRAPGPPRAFFETGTTPGQVRLEIYAEPDQLGDGPIPGDLAGEVTGYRVALDGQPAADFGTGLPRVVVQGGYSPSSLVGAVVQTIGYGGRLSLALYLSATAAPEVEPELLTWDDPISGTPWTDPLTSENWTTPLDA